MIPIISHVHVCMYMCIIIKHKIHAYYGHNIMYIYTGHVQAHVHVYMYNILYSIQGLAYLQLLGLVKGGSLTPLDGILGVPGMLF